MNQKSLILFFLFPAVKESAAEIYKLLMDRCLRSLQVVYSVVNGWDSPKIPVLFDYAQNIDSDPRVYQPLLLRAAPKEFILHLCFQLSTPTPFLKMVFFFWKYFLSSSEVIVRSLHALSRHTALPRPSLSSSQGWSFSAELSQDISHGVCRALTIWMAIESVDVKSDELFPLLPSLLKALNVEMEEELSTQGESVASLTRFHVSKESLSLQNDAYLFEFCNLLNKKFRSERDEAQTPFSGLFRSLSQSVDNQTVDAIQATAQAMFSQLSQSEIDVVAEHFLIFFIRLQKEISEDELFSFPIQYSSSNTSTVRTHLSAINSFINDLSRWAELVVLSRWNAEDRAGILQYLISLAERLEAKQCFPACMGITMGLSSPHIERSVFDSLNTLIEWHSRLKETWSYVHEDKVMKLASLKILFSPIGNFGEYRKLVTKVVASANPASGKMH
jgi:hypothetical protein